MYRSQHGGVEVREREEREGSRDYLYDYPLTVAQPVGGELFLEIVEQADLRKMKRYAN